MNEESILLRFRKRSSFVVIGNAQLSIQTSVSVQQLYKNRIRCFIIQMLAITKIGKTTETKRRYL